MAAVVAVLSLSALSGCAAVRTWRQSQWEGDYDTAVAQSRARRLPILIHYSSRQPGRADPLSKTLADQTLDKPTRRFVRCRLFRSYEPDRRFMGQFNVRRAPALVVLKRDGSYHAAVGMMSVDDVRKFLVDAQAPGKKPVANNNLPHILDYAWIDDLNEARLEAQQRKQGLLVVYRQRLTNHWRHLQTILERQEVYRRLADMVHCRVDIWNAKAGVFISPFGVIKLPAVVLVDSQGTFEVLEQPTSYEAVVRFADRFLAGTKQPSLEAMAKNSEHSATQ